MKSISMIAVFLVATFLSATTQAVDKVLSNGEIDAIESAYRSIDDLTAKFTQSTQIELLARTVTKHGLFQFKKGGKLRIEYKDKGGKYYVSDGSTIWTYVPGDDASLETFAVNDKTMPKEALSFLNGFGKLSKEFSISATASFDAIPANSAAMRLTPRAKNAQYEWLDALFGPDHLLKELVVKNRSGNVSRYTFMEIKTNSSLPDKLFTLSSGKATPDTLPE